MPIRVNAISEISKRSKRKLLVFTAMSANVALRRPPAPFLLVLREVGVNLDYWVVSEISEQYLIHTLLLLLHLFASTACRIPCPNFHRSQL